MSWDLSDFVFIGVLTFFVAVAFLLIVRTFSKISHKIAFSLVLILAALYLWAEFAVGIFTNLGS